MGFKHRFRKSFGGSLVVLALSISPALAEELQNWAFDISSSELTFSLSDQVFPEFFLLSEPPRLVLDIPNVEIGNIDPEQIYEGAVKTIRVAQHTSETVRVVIELASDIVLSPEQADIQFDDNADGRRHWRFRPLIAESTGNVATAVSNRRTASNISDISVSAANLQLSTEPTHATALPIDPYESEASTDIVSVPPLTAEEVVTVPPLDAALSEADSAVAEADGSVAVAVAPELPPMVVPALEDTAGIDDASIPNAIEEETPRELNLPELGTDPVDASQPNISETVEPAVSPQDLESPAVAEPVEEVPAVIVTEDVLTTPIATETALAPVESSALSARAVSDGNSESLAPAPIQQPAAERTIRQTELPNPLTFGQPLPNRR